MTLANRSRSSLAAFIQLATLASLGAGCSCGASDDPLFEDDAGPIDTTDAGSVADSGPPTRDADAGSLGDAGVDAGMEDAGELTPDAGLLPHGIVACTWDTELVDDAENAGRESVILPDEAGGLRIVYSGVTSLHTAHRPAGGGAWTRDPIPNAAWGLGLSVVVDDTGRAHAAFRDCDAGGCAARVASYAIPDWEIADLDAEPGASRGSFIDLAERDGALFASYVDIDDGVRHAVLLPGGSWSSESVIDAPALGSAMGVTHNGRRAIAYPTWLAPAGMHVALRPEAETSWTFETVDTGKTGHPSIAGGEGDVVHLSYMHYPTCQLRYARRSPAGVWSVETVARLATPGGVCPGLDTEIVLDETGNLHIAFIGASIGYAVRRPGTTWHVETVDAPTTIDSKISLLIDDTGHAHVTYANYVPAPEPPAPGGHDTHELWYARRPCGL